MYAIILDGGRQFKVEEGQELSIDFRDLTAGAQLTFDKVLAISSGSGDLKLGAPTVAGATVTAEVLGAEKGEKIVVQKFRRRKNSRRKIGHRQDLTTVRILEVLAAGQSPSKKPTGVGVIPLSHRGRRFETLSAPEGGKADDLSLIDGVGPKMLQKLNGAGVYHFWQLAALTNTEAAALEKKVDFDNRLAREEWVAQAKELLAGKPPRAKSDRDRAEAADNA